MPDSFDGKLAALVDAWCELREYTLLRIIPQAYPRVSRLADEWGNLARVLMLIRERFPKRLISGELSTVIELQSAAEQVAGQRHG